jgi:hypothetical protein
VVASHCVAERPPYVVLCLHDRCEDILSQHQYPVSVLVYHESADSAVKLRGCLRVANGCKFTASLLLPTFISLLLVLSDIINFVTVFVFFFNEVSLLPSDVGIWAAYTINSELYLTGSLS